MAIVMRVRKFSDDIFEIEPVQTGAFFPLSRLRWIELPKSVKCALAMLALEDIGDRLDHVGIWLTNEEWELDDASLSLMAVADENTSP
jgi:hypothetical protein